MSATQTLHPGQVSCATQRCAAGVDPSPPEPNDGATPTLLSARADVLLLIYADALDDLERVRIATENRVRSLAQVKGMDGSPEQARLSGLTDALCTLEHGAELELKRALRQHPLGPWVRRTLGVGEKQGARLLASIGDPTTRATVSQLWAFAGYHVLHSGHSRIGTHGPNAGVDPSSNPGQEAGDTHVAPAGVAPSRRKGVKANWNSTAKMRAYLCAEAAVKAGVRKVGEPDDSDGYDTANRVAISPLGQTYLDGRAKYATSLHPVQCARCGPAGHPAPEGSPLSAGHQHARALRLVSKAILRDLWVEARRLQDRSSSGE